MEANNHIFIPMFVFFGAFYIAIWVGSFWFAARYGGWSELAEKYTCQNPYDGPKKGWQWGKFGWIDYKSCLWIAVIPEGLYLETGPGFLFKPFHPNLLIPWSAIKSVRETKYWFMRVIEITFNDINVKLMLRERFLEDMQPFLGAKFKSSDKSSQLIED